MVTPTSTISVTLSARHRQSGSRLIVRSRLRGRIQWDISRTASLITTTMKSVARPADPGIPVLRRSRFDEPHGALHELVQQAVVEPDEQDSRQFRLALYAPVSD